MPQIINLLRVPGVHQVMLQVRMAEVNRTGLREIGGDILAVHSGLGMRGTKIGGGTITASGIWRNGLAGLAAPPAGARPGTRRRLAFSPAAISSC